MTDKKTQFRTYLTPEVIAQLDKLGGIAGGQTGNTLAAMILSEFSRVPATSAAIWEALGRISEETTPKSLNALEGGAPGRSKRAAVETLAISR